MAKFEAMQTFVKVAETSSFAEAARRLHMSPPAVTRAVSALEGQIGTRLFTRTTRVVRLTEAGSRYFDDCRKILADVEEAEAAASGSYVRPTGLLHVTASVLFGQQFMVPILTDFLRENPEVTIRALFVDRVVSLVDEGIDVSIRIGHLPDSSHSAIKVGKVRQVICGAPAYFAAHGVPSKPADLASHSISTATGSFAALDWQFGKDQKQRVRVKPRLFCSTYDAVIRATLDGWGLARVLSYHIGEHLVAGRLQTVLADFEQEPLPIHIVHPEGRRASAKVRAFVDLVADRLRGNRLIN